MNYLVRDLCAPRGRLQLQLLLLLLLERALRLVVALVAVELLRQVAVAVVYPVVMLLVL